MYVRGEEGKRDLAHTTYPWPPSLVLGCAVRCCVSCRGMAPCMCVSQEDESWVILMEEGKGRDRNEARQRREGDEKAHHEG